MGEQMIAAIGSEKAPILVKLTTFNGRRSLDIRRYFYPRGTRELKPTQKGVGFSREAFTIFKNVLNQYGEVIEKWLITEDPDVWKVRQDHTEQLAAIGSVRTSARPHIADYQSWKSTAFFDVRAEGAIDHLTYNQSHNFRKYLDGLRDSTAADRTTENLRIVNDFEELLERLLIAYQRSKMLFDHTQQMKAADIFETLELNWGAILAAYLESDSRK
jgi:hypothetical protein